MALGATRRRGSRSPVKLNPRNFLCTAHESRYLLAFPFIPLAGYRSGLPPFFWSNTPSADFCGTIRVHRFTLSHDSVTYRRSPEVSSTAFDAQPSDLPPVYLMDTDFAIIRSLAHNRRPLIRFLFIGSHLRSALLSGPASRRVLFHPCASLSLHVHHVVKRTFTSMLSIMLGTQK
jgi:hypothetical protein